MNTNIRSTFRRLGRNTLFVALLSVAITQAQARPVLPLFFGAPEVSAPVDRSATNSMRWREVERWVGPRGTVPIFREESRSLPPQREIERWVGPRGTVPIYRDD